MDKIIKPDKYQNHNVQKYQFKTLDTDMSPINKMKEDNQQNPPLPSKEIPIQPIKKDDDNLLSKELLEKNEEIFLALKEIQDKMQKQQEEFEQRLKKESKRAFEEGKEEGIKQISQDIANQNDEIKDQFLKSIELLTEQKTKIDTLIDKLKSDIPQLATMIAKKVIEKELDDNSSQITKQIANTLVESFEESSSVVIKVNPIDYKELKSIYKDNKYIKVKPDDAITKGGVVIISDNGNIDADIPTRIQKVIDLIEKDY